MYMYVYIYIYIYIHVGPGLGHAGVALLHEVADLIIIII